MQRDVQRKSLPIESSRVAMDYRATVNGFSGKITGMMEDEVND